MDESRELIPPQLRDLIADSSSRSNEVRQPPLPENTNSHVSISTSSALQPPQPENATTNVSTSAFSTLQPPQPENRTSHVATSTSSTLQPPQPENIISHVSTSTSTTHPPPHPENTISNVSTSTSTTLQPPQPEERTFHVSASTSSTLQPPQPENTISNVSTSTLQPPQPESIISHVPISASSILQPPESENNISQLSLSTSSSLQCWICYATQEDDPRLKWIKPCKCRGGTKWVHQTCLQSWVDQKLRDGQRKSIACPQCKTAYLIHFPAMSVLAQFLDAVDELNNHFSSLIVDCFVLASVYWSALSYGAMTVVYVEGTHSQRLVQSIHPTVFLVGLPLIPVAAIVVGSIEWELHLCRILTFVLHRIPIVGPNVRQASEDPAVVLFDRRISERMSSTRKFITSIFLPTVAKLFGDVFYSTMPSVFRRFLAGGVTFIGVKTTITYYHRRQICKKLTDLKILDYTDENRERFTANNEV